MRLILGKLVYHVGNHVVLSPEGVVLVTSPGTQSSHPRRSQSLKYSRIVVACTVDKDGPLALLPEMVMELIHIHTAKQYPMPMPTLFLGNLATREGPYNSLATSWTGFALLKHITSPAIDGDAFAPAFQGSSSHAHPMAISPAFPTESLRRKTRRNVRPDSTHGALKVSPTHSRRYPFSVDYGLWLFDDRDYNIVCTATNNIVNTDLSLWTPLVSEDARRQACVQCRGRCCCNCSFTERIPRWCRTSEARTLGISVHLMPNSQTEVLTLARVPLASALAC